MVRVGYDTQIFDWQINGGISRYFIEVVNRLDKNTGFDVLLQCRHSYNTYIQQTPWLLHNPVLPGVNFKGKLALVKMINQLINRPYSNGLLKHGGIDIFHPTYYDPYFLPYLKVPFVLTVYDLTNEKFNDQSALTLKVLAWKKTLIAAADHIIAISENTRKDIIEYYHVAPEKVTTVYLSGGFESDIHNTPAADEAVAIPKQFILFVGSRRSYKNFIAFVKEVAPVVKKEGISLVVAGGGAFDAAEVRLLEEEGITAQTVLFPHVSDSFLARLYKNALVFIFPSLYEGFGLPVLEAMQCNCPALLSNNSSLPEVGGAAAQYFDPHTEGSLNQALQELINDPEKRKAMTLAGIEQVKHFNWDVTAQQHIDVYTNTINNFKRQGK